MVTIKLTNSKTHRKEVFEPLDPRHVRMYVCGPTVYDRAHLGNARPVVVFDVAYRLLRHVYGAEAVTYVRNFTDVDDKINAKAAETGRAIRDITDETIGWYHDDMDALGALRPNHEPRATEFIGAMIAMIEGLVAKGHAYAAEGHVLFRVRSYAEYGALSGRSVDDMIAGARVEVAPFKEDPMDFVLWKPSEAGVPGWESPWGYGRPGWHIECSAMAYELLGESFDIHGGGLDLQFPHHENEIAQSACAHGHGSFARVWLHNEMLLVEGKKMSKSLGNFFTVRDLLAQGVPGEVIRFVLLSTHYRKPMDWTDVKRKEAEKRLDNLLRPLKTALNFKTDAVPSTEYLPEALLLSLADDLNTSDALKEMELSAELFLRLERGQVTPTDESLNDALPRAARQFLAALDMLGFYDNLVQRLQRNEAARDKLEGAKASFKLAYETAKKTKQFSAVDAMKVHLMAAGVEVRISKEGVELVPGPDFDPAKLEALK